MSSNDLTIYGAFVFGLITSLHCVGMCGPLACGVVSIAKNENQRLLSIVSYHVARIFSYCIIGSVFGTMGKLLLLRFFNSNAIILPIILGIVLILMAFDIDKKLPRPKFFDKIFIKLRSKINCFPSYLTASLVGGFTVFLPCTPLYFLFGISWFAGSALKGAELTLAFGMGTVPLLWIMQYFFKKLKMNLSSNAIRYLRQSIAIFAAILIFWRMYGVSTAQFGINKEAKSQELPSCCPKKSP